MYFDNLVLDSYTKLDNMVSTFIPGHIDIHAEVHANCEFQTYVEISPKSVNDRTTQSNQTCLTFTNQLMHDEKPEHIHNIW